MNSAHQNPRVISLCADQKLLDSLKECNKLLDQVKGRVGGEGRRGGGLGRIHCVVRLLDAVLGVQVKCKDEGRGGMLWSWRHARSS